MRRIEESLQACLEDLEAGADVAQALEQGAADAHLRGALLPMLDVAERYREAPEVLPSAEFRQAARARMLGMIAAEPESHRRPRASSPWLPRSWPAPLARAAATVLAVLLLAVGGGTAALASPPSSPLFGARLALEHAEVLVTPSAGARLELRLEIADRRAGELEAMAGTASRDGIALAAQRYESALRGEVDEAATVPEVSAAVLDQRLAAQEEMLGRARARASDSAAGDLENALSAVAWERARLRQRHGWDVTTPAVSPTESSAEVDSAESAATTTPGDSAEPLATTTTGGEWADGVGQNQGSQERTGGDHLGGTATTGRASTPTPSTTASTQERTGQQTPTTPDASPRPTPAPSQPKPGGQVAPGPSGAQPVATSSGAGSGSGRPGGAQSGTPGGKGGR